jgi:hypothetical protein
MDKRMGTAGSGRSLRARGLSVVIVVLAPVMSACAVEDLVFGSPVASPPAVVAEPPPATNAAVIEAGGCVDVSSSFPRPLLRKTMSVLADLALNWPAPPSETDGSEPWPGLHLTIRAIGTDVYGVGGALIDEPTIPGIPSVIGPGDPTSPGFVQWNRARGDQLQAARDAFERANEAAETLSASIRELDPPEAMTSGVWDCISALGELQVDRVIVISDFLQRGEPQIAGSLEGTAVLGVIVCDTVRRCDAETTRWTADLLGRGASEVVFVRFERLEGAMAPFVRGGAVG